jgi:hypothetical protein
MTKYFTKKERQDIQEFADFFRDRILAQTVQGAPEGSELAVVNGILLGAHALISAFVETLNGLAKAGE